MAFWDFHYLCNYLNLRLAPLFVRRIFGSFGNVLGMMFSLRHVLMLNLGFGDILSLVMRNGFGDGVRNVLGDVQGAGRDCRLVVEIACAQVRNLLYFGLVLSPVNGLRLTWWWLCYPS